jgi:hypothetical protein
MNRIYRLFAFAIVITGSASCQKVIDVKLNSAAQRYVIEGEVNDGPGPYTVTISRTRDFAENNNFEQIGGGLVVITDVTANISDTLRESNPGTYRTSRLAGVLGHSYRLSVLVGGQSFTANSVMPAKAVDIDSLYIRPSALGGDNIFMVAQYLDPVGTGNYYRARQWINDTAVKGSRIRSDYATDGILYRGQMMYDASEESGNPKVKIGDKIEVELQCINEEVYEYYRTLTDVTGENSATPANPLSNITGGALGIFNTCTSRRRTSIAAY